MAAIAAAAQRLLQYNVVRMPGVLHGELHDLPVKANSWAAMVPPVAAAIPSGAGSRGQRIPDARGRDTVQAL